jgi:hypothetical protein
MSVIFSCFQDYPYIRGEPTLESHYDSNSTDFYFACAYSPADRVEVTYFINWLHNAEVIGEDIEVVGSGVTELKVVNITDFMYMSNVSKVACLSFVVVFMNLVSFFKCSAL